MGVIKMISLLFWLLIEKNVPKIGVFLLCNLKEVDVNI